MSYKDKFWNNLGEMIGNIKEETSGFLGFGDKSNATDSTWEINAVETEVIGSFLKQWQVYLSPVHDLMIPLFAIPGWFVKWLYAFSEAIENVFNNIFSLFGFFSLLQQDSFVANVYGWLRAGGIAIFILFLTVRIIMSWLGTPFKYKEFLNHLILVTAATSFLPQALISFSSTFANAGSDLMKYNSSNTVEQDNLSVIPVKNNITDLMVLFENDFDVDVLGREEGDNGYINPSKIGNLKLNSITPSNVKNIDFTASYGASDQEGLKHLGEWKKGLPTVLHSTLESFEYDGDEPKYVYVKGHKPQSFLDPISSINVKSYPRYKVNWIALYVQQIMLIMLLIGLLINTIQTIFRTLLSATIAPIVGYTSVEDSSKFLDLLQQIFAGIAGIWFEILIVRYGMWFLTFARTVSLKGFGLFTDGLGFFEQSVADIALYIAVFLAVAQGSRAIENWLGIQTGAKSGMMAAAGTAFAASQLTKGTVNAVAGRKGLNGQRHGGLVRNAGKVLSGTKDFGGKSLKGAALGVSTLAGSGAGFVKAVKSHEGSMAKTMAQNTYDSTIGKGVDYVSGKMGDANSAMKEQFDRSKDAVHNFATDDSRPFKQPSPTAPDNPGSPGISPVERGGQSEPLNAEKGFEELSGTTKPETTSKIPETYPSTTTKDVLTPQGQTTNKSSDWQPKDGDVTPTPPSQIQHDRPEPTSVKKERLEQLGKGDEQQPKKL